MRRESKYQVQKHVVIKITILLRCSNRNNFENKNKYTFCQLFTNIFWIKSSLNEFQFYFHPSHHFLRIFDHSITHKWFKPCKAAYFSANDISDSWYPIEMSFVCTIYQCRVQSLFFSSIWISIRSDNYQQRYRWLTSRLLHGWPIDTISTRSLDFQPKYPPFSIKFLSLSLFSILSSSAINTKIDINTSTINRHSCSKWLAIICVISWKYLVPNAIRIRAHYFTSSHSDNNRLLSDIKYTQFPHNNFQ